LLEATERCLHIGVGCELTALGLSKAVQHGRKVRRVNFELALVAAEASIASAILFWCPAATAAPLQGLFEELGHGSKMGSGVTTPAANLHQP
jgi:hypothetical protein